MAASIDKSLKYTDQFASEDLIAPQQKLPAGGLYRGHRIITNID